MKKMREHKNFWDKNAGRYDRFMRKDRAAYDEMYELIRPEVKAKTVLELATGTGLIAKHIVNAAAHIEATDASAEMIAEAKRDTRSAKLHFSVQDMFRLPYADKSFDVVIVSNALHIVPQPEKALAEIRRVLKDDGVLIAPTFTHAGNSFTGKVRAFFMKLAGFPLHSKWTSAEYLRFLRQNSWTVRKSAVLKASFQKACGAWRENHGRHDEPGAQSCGTVGTSLFGAYSGRQGAGLRLRRRCEHQETSEKMPGGYCQGH